MFVPEVGSQFEHGPEQNEISQRWITLRQALSLIAAHRPLFDSKTRLNYRTDTRDAFMVPGFRFLVRM